MLQEGFQGYRKSSYHFHHSSLSKPLSPCQTIFMSTFKSFSITKRLNGASIASLPRRGDGLEEMSGRERHEGRRRTRKRPGKIGMRVWNDLESPDSLLEFNFTPRRPRRRCWRCMSGGWPGLTQSFLRAFAAL